MRALLLLLTACWSSSQPSSSLPPPQPSEPVASSSHFQPRTPRNSCRSTVDKLAEHLRPEFAKTGMPEATIDELAETTIDSCQTMEWSPDLMQCFAHVQDANDLSNCRPLMTQEESDDLQRRMMDVISRMTQQPTPPTP